MVKDPYTAVVAIRLMAGIAVEPRIASANLAFDVNKEHIISRFSEFCGHGASVKISGPWGIGDTTQEVNLISHTSLILELLS